jgi:hypothetical protein
MIYNNNLVCAVNIATSFAVRLFVVLVAIYFNPAFMMIIYNNTYNYYKIVRIICTRIFNILYTIYTKARTFVYTGIIRICLTRRRYCSIYMYSASKCL